MEILAPAKINLFLEVKNRRPDGYHDIESVMHSVSLYDRLIIEPRSRGITLKCTNPSLSSGDDNIVLKAANLLKEDLGVSFGAKIILEKNIPLGAGLGGGSSDAAAVLKGLLKIWDKKISRIRLLKLSSRLGADVPFFIFGGTAVACGIGEKLKRLKKARSAKFILVYPRYQVSTRWVYENLNFPLTKDQKINKITDLITAGSSSGVWGKCIYNRLEEVVFRKYPEIEHIKKTLKDLGCLSMMSGSGSTVFGILPYLEQGERIRLKLIKSGWDVHLVEST